MSNVNPSSLVVVILHWRYRRILAPFFRSSSATGEKSSGNTVAAEIDFVALVDSHCPLNELGLPWHVVAKAGVAGWFRGKMFRIAHSKSPR